MRYRRSPQMQQRLADKRERIVRATRKLIATGGFRQAPVAAVAAVAGLSTGAIYRHFASQAELFIEVLTAAVRHEIAILNAITQAGGDARQRLARAVASFASRALQGRNLAYAFIAEPIDAEVARVRIRCRREFSAVFARLLSEGIASGEFPRQDVETGAACIVGAFTEALIGPIAPGAQAVKAADQTRLIGAICDFCLSAVTTRPRPPTRAKSPSRPRAKPVR